MVVPPKPVHDSESDLVVRIFAQFDGKLTVALSLLKGQTMLTQS